ncbi:MAG: glutathione S-transferase family protein [Gammaproteobacteria bacterium]|nr:glutathione S-transferase family protein [Gammaproteobacteria bacterium]
MQLIIGNKNYSSWSLRPWLLMQYFSVEFSEQQIWLFSDEMAAQMQQHAPNLKVPVLQDNQITIWDSLAICEYINEQYLAGKAWPQDTAQRAMARSICAEMHAGFFAIRAQMPMNCRRAPSEIEISKQAQHEVQRVIEIFEQCLATNTESDSFLFGEFSIADAFYMPIVCRFSSYQTAVGPRVKQYFSKMLALEAYQTWLKQATAETAVISAAEV